MQQEWANSFFSSLANSVFHEQAKLLQTAEIHKHATIPFKDHSQFTLMMDIIARKYKHHLVLKTQFASTLDTVFLQALSQFLLQEHLSLPLRQAPIIYLNLSQVNLERFIKELPTFFELMNQSKTYVLLALTHAHLLASHPIFNTLLHHPHCRLLLLQTEFENEEFFVQIELKGCNHADILLLLKQQRDELEQFHQVIISDESLTEAYALTGRYLSVTDTLNQTLLLLDSAAARIGNMQSMSTALTSRPVLTNHHLLTILSDWTQIPVSHLPLQKFKLNEFTIGIQQYLFGQEKGVTLIAHAMQQAQARLHDKIGAFASMLLVGPPHTGKRTAAWALSQQVFKQTKMLYIAQCEKGLSQLANLSMQSCDGKQYLPLKKLIHQLPHAVLLFENIENAHPDLLEDVIHILKTGYFQDASGEQHCFHQAIILLSTTLGSERLKQLNFAFPEEQAQAPLDLMQLIMNEKKQAAHHSGHHYTANELAAEITADLAHYLPLDLCQYATLIPFSPLNRQAMEQIIRLKLKILGKQLEARHGVELGYAPEVVRYLANEVIHKQEIDSQTASADIALSQLYFAVEKTILNQAASKEQSNQLFLQLNESGQVLRCDWLMNMNAGLTVS